MEENTYNIFDKLRKGVYNPHERVYRYQTQIIVTINKKSPRYKA